MSRPPAPATPGTPVPAGPASRSTAWSVLVGLTSLVVVLQGLWAGLFLGRVGSTSSWVGVHAAGAYLAVLLALAALVVAFLRLRSRRDLLAGTGLLLLALVAEVGLGQAIGDGGARGLTAVHVPLAMLLVALVVWLPLRARAGTR